MIDKPLDRLMITSHNWKKKIKRRKKRREGERERGMKEGRKKSEEEEEGEGEGKGEGKWKKKGEGDGKERDLPRSSTWIYPDPRKQQIWLTLTTCIVPPKL